ncbi:hypothetical protein V5O48_014200 [Marasmius crinis-equi]|uniref:F-box domain-containing protein n=1 Tax=Marasmius crinis-equi TaxID=585013 RepID=A0ABR3EY24_9AGAR
MTWSSDSKTKSSGQVFSVHPRVPAISIHESDEEISSSGEDVASPQDLEDIDSSHPEPAPNFHHLDPFRHPINPRFLRYTFVPDPREISRLKHILEESTGKLASHGFTNVKAINLEEEELDDELWEEVYPLFCNVRNCRAILATHRKLPTEIWQIIFNIASEFAVGYSLASMCSPCGTPCSLWTLPLTITQVCSRWGSIIRSTPSAWSSIKLELCRLYIDIEPLLETYLKYSKGHTLRISISVEGPAASKYGRTAWETLSGHLSRCTEFIFDIWGGDLSAPRNFELFPHLEFFQGDGGVLTRSPGKYSWLSQALSRGAPNLTRMSLLSRLYSWIPCTLLRSLEVRRLEGKDMRSLSLLSTCNHLESLAFTEMGYCRMEPGTFHSDIFQKVELSSLRKLEIREARDHVFPTGYGTRLARILLGSLVLPFLRELVLEQREWLGNDLLHTITQRSPGLERVVLYAGAADEPLNSSPPTTLLSFLPNLLNLKYFRFSLSVARGYSSPYPDAARSDFVDTALTTFLSKLLEPTALPNLQHIWLGFSYITLDNTVVDRALTVAASRPSLRQIAVLRMYKPEELKSFKFERVEKGASVCVRESRWSDWRHW